MVGRFSPLVAEKSHRSLSIGFSMIPGVEALALLLVGL